MAVIILNSFVLGLLTSIVFFVVVGVVFFVGYRLGNKGKKTIRQQELTEDEQKEQDRLQDLHKGFVKLMNYDVSTALTRKKV